MTSIRKVKKAIKAHLRFFQKYLPRLDEASALRSGVVTHLMIDEVMLSHLCEWRRRERSTAGIAPIGQLYRCDLKATVRLIHCAEAARPKESNPVKKGGRQ